MLLVGYVIIFQVNTKCRGYFMKKRLFKTFLVLLLMVVLFPLSGAKRDIHLNLIGSSAPEVKLETGLNFTYPLFQGEGILTENNNLKIKTKLGISPVSATFDVDFVLTPVAFAEVSLGGTVGGGWTISEKLNGAKIYCTCNNSARDDNFAGSYLKGKIGGALQFDTAAFFDNKWASIFARTYQELSLQSFSTAESGQYWNFEMAGYKIDGRFYHAEYVVGYNMPIMLNTIAVMLETDINNFRSHKETEMLLTLSAIANLKILDNLNVTIIGQFNDKKSVDNDVVQKGSLKFSKVVGMVKYSF
jgi:hypothetical protein